MRQSPRRPFAQTSEGLGCERPRVILRGPLALMAGAAWFLLRAEEPSWLAFGLRAAACAGAAVAFALWPTRRWRPPSAPRGRSWFWGWPSPPRFQSGLSLGR
jgi:hypothetical protein